MPPVPTAALESAFQAPALAALAAGHRALAQFCALDAAVRVTAGGSTPPAALPLPLPFSVVHG